MPGPPRSARAPLTRGQYSYGIAIAVVVLVLFVVGVLR
ncbi:hypothetical protein IW248_003012 [Micromonospora ureilytica]|uniref:Uncharacterized protein n=1 Tax=Micromonospora ureilytica TaxID=709868 RepID=A0ABS0JI29_9ACTN|nr:hypothetical protein [Micromonospora ureilytica]